MADYGPLYQAAGTQFGVDPLLLQSLATEESTQNPNAVGPVTRSGQQAGGLFQFMPPTAQQYGVNVTDANSSAYGAANYLNDLLNRHNQDLKAALGTYTNTAPNSPYVKQIMDRYSGLTNAWRGTNAKTPASAPNFFDNEQPEATPTANASALTYTAAPAKTVQQSPEDIIRGLQPQVDAKGQPVAPAKAAPASAPDEATQTIMGLQPQVDEQGKPVNTEQSLSAPTSPGAKAVGLTPAEGQVPGSAFQAAINLAIDPAQKARIAADQLGIPLDRIISHGSGRLAAVDDNGRPYFIEPEPVFAYHRPITRGEPGTPWGPEGPFQVNPYDASSPVMPEGPRSFAPGNLLRAGGAALPAVPHNLLTPLAAGVGGPVTGALASGLTSLVTDVARQYGANLLDPRRYDLAPPVLNSDMVKNAGVNALLAGGGLVANRVFDPALDILRDRPVAPSTQFGTQIGARPFLGPGTGIPITRRQPYGNRDILAPWEAPQRWELPPNAPPSGEPPGPGGPPGGGAAAELPPAPSSPVPGAATPAVRQPGAVPSPEVQLNPAGEAAAASGPYAPSTAAEIAAIPEALPPPRWPIRNQASAEARADEIIRHFAQGGGTDADTRVLVPGSSGTLSQITGNAGLATLERGMRNVPEATNIFNAADTAQANARRAFTANLVGTPEDLTAATAARDRATAGLREAAFANTTPTGALPAVNEIDRVLAGPDGKRPGVAGPLRQLREAFFTTDPVTGERVLETDPEMLYGVRKAITDSLSPLARGTESDARAAAAQLQPVLRRLDAAIEAGAPGYRDYMTAFHEQSGPINAMEYLQGRNLTDSAGNPTLVKVDSTLKDIQRQRTLQSGARPADALSDEQIQALNNLRDDLRRQANLSKGKALGSNTVQNLATSQLGNALMAPVARTAGRVVGGGLGTVLGGGHVGMGLGVAAADYLENRLLGGMGQGENMVRDAVIRRLMNVDNSGVRALGGGPPPVSAP